MVLEIFRAARGVFMRSNRRSSSGYSCRRLQSSGGGTSDA